jgi:hypothetical protein
MIPCPKMVWPVVRPREARHAIVPKCQHVVALDRPSR